jgi:Tfp pilus assembly protein PilP
MDHLNFFRTILLKLMKVSALLFIVFFVSFQTCNAEVANSQGATNLGATQTPSNQSGYEYKNSNRPDPFKPFIAKQTLDPNELVDDSDSELTGMQLFEPGQLNLVGIMDTSSGKIALVQDVTSKGYALREGILIGKHGQIMEISDNQVVIEETYHSRNGKETKKTVLMKLKKDGDDK